MFKNRSFQKAILVLAIVALLAGTALAFRPHTSSAAGLPYDAIRQPAWISNGSLFLDQASNPFGAVGQHWHMAMIFQYCKRCFCCV